MMLHHVLDIKKLDIYLFVLQTNNGVFSSFR